MIDSLVTVIGGGGYLGSVLVRKLLLEGYPVRVFDSFNYGRAGIETLTHEKLEILEGDICNIKQLSDAIAGAEAVIMLAAIVGRRVEDIQPRYIREVNLLASSVALDASIEHGVSRFIFASTDSVYGVQSGIMYETGTPAPVSLYSRLKLRMEEQVIRSKRRDFHPSACRISTCYGASPRMRFDLVANSMIRDALLKESIVVKAGEETRALIHVDDAASAITSILKAHVSLISGEVFNVSSEGQELTMNQLANLAKGVVGDVRVEIGDEAAELTGYRLSCAKIGKVLDFKPNWSVQAGMEQVRDALIAGDYPDPYSPIYSNTR
jgi:nucleoside-diphosphate-sugar epimerase